jgi:hypothetical protein
MAGVARRIGFPDGESHHPSFVLNGEGAYQGLTAVGTIGFGATCPNTRGYIIDGSVPAPPVPNTGTRAGGSASR